MIKVYYHKNCFDGMASAWVASKKFGIHNGVEYIPITYGEDLTHLIQDCYENAIINDEIYFIDFSLPRNILDMIYNKAKKLLVIDHHKTAEEALKDAPYVIFDMNESGASLAWKTFFSPLLVPAYIRYVKDRDLWLFKENSSREINAFIQSFEMGIENSEYLYNMLDANYGECLRTGTALLRYQSKLIKDICVNYFMEYIDGYKVPCVYSSILFSEVGHELCKMNLGPFAAYKFVKKDGRISYGLRSIGDFDVSEVAKKFGGGGHKNAAGFIK